MLPVRSAAQAASGRSSPCSPSNSCSSSRAGLGRTTSSPTGARLVMLMATAGSSRSRPASPLAQAAVSSPMHAHGAGAPSADKAMGNTAQRPSLEGRANAQGPSHLVILANGLFGSPANWSTIMARMKDNMDPKQVIIHASNVNQRTATYDGIDVCGQRLAQEIRGVVSKHPSLKRISVVGHSMGGLLLRYAIGVLYDPRTKTVAGLEPCHFMTLATPHLGCEAEGVSQVPFIGWLSVASPVQRVFDFLSVPTAGLLFRRTGRQFFLADADESQQGTRVAGDLAGLPLLARMTHDVPSRGEHFFSALSSFASRTAYANTGMDHLVGWANSSLRFMHQLPKLPPEAATAKGVVLEDDLLAAFDIRFKPSQEPQSAQSSMDVPIDREQPSFSPGGRGSKSGSADSSSSSSGRNGGAGSLGNSSSKVSMVEGMLQRLQELSWRRIDVSWQGALLPLAHNHIQVTRRWLNWEGDACAAHVAATLAQLDATYQELNRRGIMESVPGHTEAHDAGAASTPSGASQPQGAVQGAGGSSAPGIGEMQEVAARAVHDAPEEVMDPRVDPGRNRRHDEGVQEAASHCKL